MGVAEHDDVGVRMRLMQTRGGGRSEPVTVDQHGCMYQPHMFGIMAGQTLKILNSDETLHNIDVCIVQIEGKLLTHG